MKQSTRIGLILLIIALLPAIVRLQAAIDPQRKQFLPGRQVVSSVVTQVGNNPVVLPSQFVAGALIGFREVVAGLLWVRVNDFFHSGNYDAIIPLNRIITWLDPHQIDVYSTGAWHLAYNFTDSQNRADRRYLIPGIKFLDEGIQNNPELWDLYFEQAFTMHYWKKQDYERSVYWFRETEKRKNCPYFVYTQAAHAYERSGHLDLAINQWRKALRITEAAYAKNPKNTVARGLADVAKRNLDLTLIRRVDRAELAKNPHDVKYEASFTRLSPRVFRVSGKIDLPDGARIEVMLTDAGYREESMDKFTWEVNPNLTLMFDTGINGIRVENGKFSRVYDLSKDLKQYPLKAEKYTLTVFYNSRSATQDIKDHTGWSGECITDRKYLDASVPGLRLIKKVFELRREDII